MNPGTAVLRHLSLDLMGGSTAYFPSVIAYIAWYTMNMACWFIVTEDYHMSTDCLLLPLFYSFDVPSKNLSHRLGLTMPRCLYNDVRIGLLRQKFARCRQLFREWQHR